MFVLQSRILLDRLLKGWRKLSWDWRAYVAFLGLVIVQMTWQLGVAVLAREGGPEFVPVGPFVVGSHVGDFVYWVSGVAVVIELYGLLLLARWAWHFSVITHGITTISESATLISGATHRAAELSGFPVWAEGFAVKLTWIESVLLVVSVGTLAWRVVRRRAFFTACGVDSGGVRAVAATGGRPPLNTPTAPIPPADENATPQEGDDDEPAARGGEGD